MFTSSQLISQPRGPVSVNWANPITKGIRLLMPLRGPDDLINIVTGQRATLTGTCVKVNSSFGSAPNFGSSNYIDFPDPGGITSGTQPVTFLWIQEPRNPTSNSTVLNWKPSGATNAFAIYQSSNSAYHFACGPRAATNIPFFAMGAPTDGRLDAFALVCAGGTDSTTLSHYTLYRNGVPFTTVTGTPFGNNTSASARIGALDSGGDPFEGLISNFIIWNRALNPQEAESVSRNPYQVFTPFSRKLWVPPSAISGVNYFQTITGSLETFGTINRLVYKNAIGSVSPASSISKYVETVKNGSLPTVGGVKRDTSVNKTGSITTSAGPVVSAGINQNISGSITLSSVLSDTITYVRSYASSITLSGTIVKPVFKRLTGVIQLTGGLVKRITKSVFGGVLTLSSTLSGFKFTPPPIGPVLTRGIRFLRKFLGRR